MSRHCITCTCDGKNFSADAGLHEERGGNWRFGERIRYVTEWVDIPPEENPDWRVESRTNFYEDGSETISWEVYCPTPDMFRGKGCWGNFYRVASYDNETDAREHAEKHRAPAKYGR